MLGWPAELLAVSLEADAGSVVGDDTKGAVCARAVQAREAMTNTARVRTRRACRGMGDIPRWWSEAGGPSICLGDFRILCLMSRADTATLREGFRSRAIV
jgi:hypothetical protein